MTPEELAKEDAWALWAAERDNGGCVSAGGLSVKLQKFPPPDVSGMTPEEESVAIKKWIDAIVQWEREVIASPATPAAPVTPTNNTTHPQTPVA